jgi:hypothetical protein
MNARMTVRDSDQIPEGEVTITIFELGEPAEECGVQHRKNPESPRISTALNGTSCAGEQM